MVAAILPVYLFSVLHLSVLQVGFLDGLYQGGAAILRILTAYWADKWQNYKTLAVLGYSLSFLARVGLFFSAGAGVLLIMGSVLIDRLGKAIRTAPRDALIAAHTPSSQWGAAYGIHRSMDAAGALCGPLLATWLLWQWVNDYERLFAVSALFALLGVAVLAIKVGKPASTKADIALTTDPVDCANQVAQPASKALSELQSESDNKSISISPITALATKATNTLADNTSTQKLSFKAWMKELLTQRRLLAIVASIFLLNLFTISDGLLYLMIQQQLGLPAHAVALMFAGTAAVFMFAAGRIGRWVDTLGVGRVLAAGYALLIVTYGVCLVLMQTPMQTQSSLPLTVSIGLAAIVVSLLGLFYAATDGVWAVVIVRHSRAVVRVSALALLATAIGLARLLSSNVFAWLWHSYDPSVAVAVCMLGMTVCGLSVLLFWQKFNLRGSSKTNEPITH